jgi:hypothetical protein
MSTILAARVHRSHPIWDLKAALEVVRACGRLQLEQAGDISLASIADLQIGIVMKYVRRWNGHEVSTCVSSLSKQRCAFSSALVPLQEAVDRLAQKMSAAEVACTLRAFVTAKEPLDFALSRSCRQWWHSLM